MDIVEDNQIENLNIPLDEEDESLEIDRGDSLEDLQEEAGVDPVEEEALLDDGDVETEEGSEESPDELEDEEGEEEVPENKIPLSRLNQVIAQRDEQRERVSFLEGQLDMASKAPSQEEEPPLVPEPAFNYSKAEREAADFLLEGEADKYNEMRETIRLEQQKEFTQQLEDVKASMRESTLSDLSDRDFNRLVDSIEQDNPFLDSSSESYNEEATDMVNSLMQGYLNNGIPRDEALIKSIDKLSPLFTEKEEAPTTKLGDSTTTKKRKVASRKKVVETLKGQPAKLRGVRGKQDIEDVNISSLSDKDFGSLSLKEKKAARGD